MLRPLSSLAKSCATLIKTRTYPVSCILLNSSTPNPSPIIRLLHLLLPGLDFNKWYLPLCLLHRRKTQSSFWSIPFIGQLQWMYWIETNTSPISLLLAYATKSGTPIWQITIYSLLYASEKPKQRWNENPSQLRTQNLQQMYSKDSM